MGEMRNVYNISVENNRGKVYLKDLSERGKIMLKCFLNMKFGGN
jgi:hypothetical protein